MMNMDIVIFALRIVTLICVVALLVVIGIRAYQKERTPKLQYQRLKRPSGRPLDPPDVPLTAFDYWHKAKYGGTFKELHQNGNDLVYPSWVLLMDRLKEFVSDSVPRAQLPKDGLLGSFVTEQDRFEYWFLETHKSKPARSQKGYKSQTVQNMWKMWQAIKAGQ